ncbi:MAG TPA: L,D-transpeptidase family protein [Chryseolinea sp.]
MRPQLCISYVLVGVLALAFLAGCASTTPQVIEPVQSDAPTVSLFRMPIDTSASAYIGLRLKESVISYYSLQKGKPIWFDSVGHISLGDSMFVIVRNIRYYGLLPQNYHLQELESLMESNDRPAVERAEALITDAFFSLAIDLHNGFGMRSSILFDSSAVQLLTNIRQKCDLAPALESREPAYSQYKALKFALRTMLDSAELPVREKLLQGEIVGASLIFKTVQSLEINLERWRRENDFIDEDRYVYINVPSFMLHVVDGGRKIFESKVIVGARVTPTPDISSKVECLVTYPYWNVPRKISVEEYLPILQRGDTSFIKRNNFDVLDRKGKVLHPDSVDWNKFNKNYFPVSLRQREGKGNSLGVIKFVFDNPYAVFLHDTNAKGLFKNEIRTYSHGCIRMEKAVDLGHYMLTGSVTKRSPTLDKYLRQEQRYFLNVTRPVPIFVRYFTCEVRDNRFYQYDDCYNMDRKVAVCLYGPR